MSHTLGTPWNRPAFTSMRRLSHQVIRPSYRSSKRRLQDSSTGSTLSLRYMGAVNPQSDGMTYCCPLNWPASTKAGLMFWKFGMSEVSQGWITGEPSGLVRLTQSCHRNPHGWAMSNRWPAATFA